MVFVKNKAKVASAVGYTERDVYFRKFLFKSNKKFSCRKVEGEKIGSHPGKTSVV